MLPSIIYCTTSNSRRAALEHNMAKSKPKLPLIKRVQQAFADLFTNVDTRVPDAENLPASVDKRKNAQVSEWMTKHRALSDFYIAHVGKQWFEAQHKKRRDALCEALGIDEKAFEPGHDETYAYGNVALRVKVDNGQTRLDKEALRTLLVTEHKFSVAEAETLINKAQKKGKPPVHLTPSTIAE